MGIVRDTLSKSIEFVQQEIMPLRGELMKAGIIVPEQNAYDQKASLVDPWAYGQTAYGYKEKYSLLDYSKCRQLTYAGPVVAAVVQTRLNQVAAYAKPQPDRYKVGFKVQLRDPDKKPSKADEKRLKEITEFMMNTGTPENFEDTPRIKRRDNFEGFLRKIVRDSLTFDQVNFEITPRKDGRPYSFQAVDAGTIRLIPDLKEQLETNRTPDDKNWHQYSDTGAYETSKYMNEFEPKHPRYAQVIQGTVRHVFDEWEMAFGVRNPRSDIRAYGYGFSEIEMLVTTITAHMNAETYNRKFFSQGSSIKGILSFEGTVPPDQLEVFRRQWYQQATGVNNAWRTPIMSLGKDGKLNWQSLHSTNREMEFGKWLDYTTKVICSVFQMDPIEIGFDISKQGSGEKGSQGGLGNGNQAERVAFSQDKGLRPLLIFIQNMINDYIVYRLDPNFQFEFVGFQNASEKDDLDKNVQQVKHYKTINEIRSENDMKDLPDFEKIKNPGDVVLDSSLLQFVQAKMQEQSGLDEGGNPIEGGMPGEPGAEGEIPPGADGGEAGGEPEPDYDSMSLEELEAELAKLDGGDAEKSERPQFLKGFFKELEL
jgi:hypothetical protein